MQNSDKIMFGYWFKKWTLNYKLSYGIVRLGVRVFYKKCEVKGLDSFPKNAGVLFAVNHQNAFMDPIVIATRLKQNIHYLTRADIFKKKIAAKFLRSLSMIPVFRPRDGFKTVTDNEKIFTQCYSILKRKGNIIVFPEGGHSNIKRLRPFKKGIARIGLGAANKYNYSIPIYVMPIGLNYSNHTKMGASLLINFGEPISLKDYYDLHKENPVSAINDLMNEIREKTEKLIVNIKSENYTIVHHILWLLNDVVQELKSENSSSLHQQLLIHQELIQKLEKLEYEDTALFHKLSDNVTCFVDFLNKEDLRSYLFNRANNIPYNNFMSLLFLCLTFPLHLLGLLSNYMPYKIPVWFVKKNAIDVHFHSSIKMTFGVLLFFGFWLVQSLLVVMIFDNHLWIYYILSLPILAWFNYKYWIFYRKTIGRIKYNKLLQNEKLNNAKRCYEEIKLSVLNLYS